MAMAIVLAAVGCSEPRAGWLGINTHLGHTDYLGHWPSARTTSQDRAIAYELLGELGVTRARDLVMCWYRAEPSQGAAYDFTVSDDLARLAGETNVSLHALCWIIPTWAAAEPTNAPWSFGVPRRDQADAFVRFVTAFVERYDLDRRNDMPKLRRPIRTYEFLNQIEHVPVEEYVFWLKLFYRTVKAADPQAIVSLGSLSSPGYRTVDRPDGDYPSYFDRLLAALDRNEPGFPFFDAVAFHHYPASYPGREPFADPMAYLKQVLDRYDLKRPIWVTEFGVNAGTNSASEQTAQASELIRLVVEARALGAERAYLHCLRDYHYPDRPGPGENYGLVRESPPGQPPQRKVAFNVFRNLIEHTRDNPVIRLVQPGVYAVETTRETSYVAWRADSYKPQPRVSEIADNWFEVTTVGGRRSVEHGSKVRLTDSPILLKRSLSPFLAG
jgi:hypothetical protein